MNFYKYCLLIIFAFVSLNLPTVMAQSESGQIKIIEGLNLGELPSLIMLGDQEKVREYLKKHPLEINSVDNEYGDTPLHFAATFNQFAILKMLIEDFGANPRILSKRSTLCIDKAAFVGNIEMVDYLLNKHYVSINHEKSTDGTMTIHDAILGTNAKMVKLLLINGAKRESSNPKTPSAKALALMLYNDVKDKKISNLIGQIILQRAITRTSISARQMESELWEIIEMLK